MDEIIQLKITLQGSKPAIWRQVLVNSSATLEELHHIIQIVMGWTNSHLYEFIYDGYRIAELNEEFDAYLDQKTVDPTNVLIENIFIDKNEKLIYTYDFGDGWDHIIVAEKSFPLNPKIKYPVCVDGELNCPPEDCGGIPGFYNMLQIINSKRHPEKKELLRWLNGYDPAHFDINEINNVLSSLDQYIRDFKNHNAAE